jgi:hypothetical protein
MHSVLNLPLASDCLPKGQALLSDNPLMVITDISLPDVCEELLVPSSSFSLLICASRTIIETSSCGLQQLHGLYSTIQYSSVRSIELKNSGLFLQINSFVWVGIHQLNGLTVFATPNS